LLEQACVTAPLWVSVISVWKIALLKAKGRLRLPISVNTWMDQALSRPEIRLLGLDRPQIVIDSCRLPGAFHPDPADRILLATARFANATLVTHDQKMIDYGKLGHVQVLPT